MFNCKKAFYSIGMAAVLLAVGSGCAKEKTEEEKAAEAFKNVIAKSASQSEASAKKPPTVESKLMEINNFVIKNLWNEGFVNIKYYVNKGTDSSGQKIDMDFTLERLAKAMEQKTEYAAYIQGLDTKYDDVKKVWTKLSGEIDRMYKYVQENKPQANDDNYKFDTGSFLQYSEAFSSDITKLNKK